MFYRIEVKPTNCEWTGMWKSFRQRTLTKEIDSIVHGLMRRLTFVMADKNAILEKYPRIRCHSYYTSKRFQEVRNDVLLLRRACFENDIDFRIVTVKEEDYVKIFEDEDQVLLFDEYRV